MKKTFVLLGIMMLTLMQVLADSPKPYKLKVLTFEDADAKDGFQFMVYDEVDGERYEWYRTNNLYNKYLLYSSDETLFDEIGYWEDYLEEADVDFSNPWSRLITPDQRPDASYNPMLYKDWSDMNVSPIYYWYDGGNTFLYSGLANFYKGQAVSHYWSSDFASYGNANYQLTVYKEGSDDVETSGGGHDGSDNFCIHFGYIDYGDNPANLPSIEFKDGVARVIDHMYVANTTYNYRSFNIGDPLNLTNPVHQKDSVWIEAYGFTSQEAVDSRSYDAGPVQINLINGRTGEYAGDWTEWDLSGLGAVVKVAFNMNASEFGHSGGKMMGNFLFPGYFAYDDVAVRFPRWSYTRDGLTPGNYGTICLPRDINIAAGDYVGAEFYKVVDRTEDWIELEEVTTTLTAGQAYIYKATATTFTVYSDDDEDQVAEPAEATTANVLQGVFAETQPSTGWILYHNELHQCAGHSHTVPANRAYLTELIPAVTEPAPGRRRVKLPIQQAPTELQNVEAQDAQAQKAMQNGVLYINKNGYMYDVKGQIVK